VQEKVKLINKELGAEQYVNPSLKNWMKMKFAYLSSMDNLMNMKRKSLLKFSLIVLIGVIITKTMMNQN